MAGSKARSTPRLAPRAILCLLGGALLVLTACTDSGLEQRVDRLEAELREVRSDTRDQVRDLTGRVISAETTVGIDPDSEPITDRFTRLEATVGEWMTNQTETGQQVYLRPNLPGHAPLATDHGTFLARLEDIDLNPSGERGFLVHLSIGNPHALTIEQFSLVGDYGGAMPQLPEGENYSLENERIREWQRGLTPFEVRVSEPLAAFAWTSFDIVLPAATRQDLELIRFSMTVENARLNRETIGAGAGEDYSHIRVDSQGAAVLKTDYGAFLVTVQNSEATDNGTRLYIEIGNPYGFKINQCRFVGEFGPEVPTRDPGDTQDSYAQKVSAWSQSLRSFEAGVSEQIANFRWNRATLLIPGPPEEVKFLRAQLRVEDITLPAAIER
ncbi:MAG: hypothetical protein AAF236_12250 [Verrucomicrobiota bacterium]